jgi:TonB family protein
LILYGLIEGLAHQGPPRVRPEPPNAWIIPDEHHVPPETQRAKDPRMHPVPKVDITPIPVDEDRTGETRPPLGTRIDAPPTVTGKSATPALDAGDELITTHDPGAIGGNCANAASVGASIQYPARARRLGLTSGEVRIAFAVTPGGQISIQSVSSSDRAFEESALQAVAQLRCRPGSYSMPIQYRLGE